ncbi:hypothetical protein [Janibacter sp. DB-40]|uniref:hypothetical protein n=1 Tax=Janibacter sp. DB-40 TaxID=3028808 RepID=UPI002404E0B6|nr:hypothetical protein [Janibacter sp. DB-40]
MVHVRDFEAKTSGEASRTTTTSSCGYRTVDMPDGTLAVQLETYGSDERKLLGKASQTIELDRDRAAELIHILREATPGP